MWMTHACLHHLNEVRPTIKFTMELEKDGSIPFLDTSLTRREDGTLNVTVFRKQTLHTRTGTACTLTPTTQQVQRGQPSGVSSTGLGTSHYGRRTCGKKKNTSPLLSDWQNSYPSRTLVSPASHYSHSHVQIQILGLRYNGRE